MNDDEKQIFCIRGYMKSGTNWLCRLLNLHPEIHGTGEYHWEEYFKTYHHNRKIFKYLDKIESDSATIRKELEQMVRRSMLQIGDPKAKFIGDRSPTTLHPVVFKNSAYLCMIRDVRDIVVSKVFHMLNSPRVLANFNIAPELVSLKPQFDDDPWFFHKNPEKLLASETFVRKTCMGWRKSIRANEKTAQSHPTIRVLFVHYEHLHEDLSGVLQQTVNFIGADPALMPDVPRYLQPGLRDEKPNQFNRKGEVGDWKNYMTADAQKWINEECGSLMVELGYIDSLNWAFEDVSKQNKVVAKRLGKAA